MSAAANSGCGRWCYSLVESSMKSWSSCRHVLSTIWVVSFGGCLGVERGCVGAVGGSDTLLSFETSCGSLRCSARWGVRGFLGLLCPGRTCWCGRGVGGLVVCVLNSGREHLQGAPVFSLLRKQLGEGACGVPCVIIDGCVAFDWGGMVCVTVLLWFVVVVECV
jgi:hypothetical protein